jgi:hypothetical protein
MAIGYHRLNGSAARSRIRAGRPQSGEDHGGGATVAPRDGFFPVGAVRQHPKFGRCECVRPGRTRSESSIWKTEDGSDHEIVNWFWPVPPGFKRP